MGTTTVILYLTMYSNMILMLESYFRGKKAQSIGGCTVEL